MSHPICNSGSSTDALVRALEGSLDLNRVRDAISEEELQNAFNIVSAVRPLDGQPSLGKSGRYHDVSYVFPALHLLPPGIHEPSLSRPRYIKYREKPKIDDYLLRPNALLMTTRFDTWSISEITAPQKFESLFDAVSHFQRYPGHTKVEAVRFMLDDKIKYRFRMTTEFLLTPTIDKEEFEADEQDVQMVFEYYKGEEHVQWVQDLRNLIERASDFTYLIVQQTLERQNGDVAARQENLIERLWHVRRITCNSEILTTHMELLRAYHDEDGIEHARFELPCGHTADFSSLDFSSNFANKAACLNYSCSVCLRKVVTASDTEIQFSFVMESDARREWYKNNRYYETLEKQMKASLSSSKHIVNASGWRTTETASFEHTPFIISEVAFKHAIQKALNSLILPGTVIPKSQNPVQSSCTKETGVVIYALNQYFHRGEEIITVAALPTVALLLRIAIVALQDSHSVSVTDQTGAVFGRIHVNYRQFLMRWFGRAITLAADLVSRKEERELRWKSREETRNQYSDVLGLFNGVLSVNEDVDMFS